MRLDERLLIVGASARAAAFSALRAGLRPWCADLFADADLRVRCPVVAIPHEAYPNGLRETATRQAPPGPWLYTGGIENHPRLIDRISQSRPLWGTRGEGLRGCRQPVSLQTVVRARGLSMPETRLDAAELPCDGSWLVKRRAGSGGTGIEPWQGQACSRGSYFQRRIDGQPCAAVYVADGRKAWLLGVSRQLVGVRWLHARPFAYCGSVGPRSLTSQIASLFDAIGDCVAKSFGLKGFFGVDCVMKDEVPWIIEVNPRYTASVEVLEYACDMAAMKYHRDVFEGSSCSASGQSPVTPGTPVGKAILFAKRPLVFPRYGPWRKAIEAVEDVRVMPEFADVPFAGAAIATGWPVCSFFVRGGSEGECLDRLRKIAADLDRRLHGE